MNQSKKLVFPISDKNNSKDIHKQSLLVEEEENSGVQEEKKFQTRRNCLKDEEAQNMKEGLEHMKNNPGKRYDKISQKFGVDRGVL